MKNILIRKKVKRLYSPKMSMSQKTTEKLFYIGREYTWKYCINMKFPELDTCTVVNKRKSLFLVKTP